MKFFKLCLFILSIAAIANISAKDLILLGFNDQRAPSIGKTFDRTLREQLAVTTDITLFDLAQTQHFNSLIHFDTQTNLSKEQLEPLRKYISDSAYIAWGILHEFTVSPKRKYVVKSQIQGEFSIELFLYNLAEQKFNYSGTIKAVVAEDRGVVFFTPVRTALHVSALDRTDMMEKVGNEVTRKACHAIAASIRSDIARTTTFSNQQPQTTSPEDTVLSKNVTVPPDSTPLKSAPVAADTSSTKTTLKDTSATKTQPKTP